MTKSFALIMRRLILILLPTAMSCTLLAYINSVDDPVRDHYEWKKKFQTENGYLP